MSLGPEEMRLSCLEMALKLGSWASSLPPPHGITVNAGMVVDAADVLYRYLSAGERPVEVVRPPIEAR